MALSLIKLALAALAILVTIYLPIAATPITVSAIPTQPTITPTAVQPPPIVHELDDTDAPLHR